MPVVVAGFLAAPFSVGGLLWLAIRAAGAWKQMKRSTVCLVILSALPALVHSFIVCLYLMELSGTPPPRGTIGTFTSISSIAALSP
jgi:hypothetical protein